MTHPIIFQRRSGLGLLTAVIIITIVQLIGVAHAAWTLTVNLSNATLLPPPLLLPHASRPTLVYRIDPRTFDGYDNHVDVLLTDLPLGNASHRAFVVLTPVPGTDADPLAGCHGSPFADWRAGAIVAGADAPPAINSQRMQLKPLIVAGTFGGVFICRANMTRLEIRQLRPDGRVPIHPPVVRLFDVTVPYDCAASDNSIIGRNVCVHTESTPTVFVSLDVHRFPSVSPTIDFTYVSAGHGIMLGNQLPHARVNLTHIAVFAPQMTGLFVGARMAYRDEQQPERWASRWERASILLQHVSAHTYGHSVGASVLVNMADYFTYAPYPIYAATSAILRDINASNSGAGFGSSFWRDACGGASQSSFPCGVVSVLADFNCINSIELDGIVATVDVSPTDKSIDGRTFETEGAGVEHSGAFATSPYARTGSAYGVAVWVNASAVSLQNLSAVAVIKPRPSVYYRASVPLISMTAVGVFTLSDATSVSLSSVTATCAVQQSKPRELELVGTECRAFVLDTRSCMLFSVTSLNATNTFDPAVKPVLATSGLSAAAAMRWVASSTATVRAVTASRILVSGGGADTDPTQPVVLLVSRAAMATLTDVQTHDNGRSVGNSTGVVVATAALNSTFSSAFQKTTMAVLGMQHHLIGIGGNATGHTTVLHIQPIIEDAGLLPLPSEARLTNLRGACQLLAFALPAGGQASGSAIAGLRDFQLKLSNLTFDEAAGCAGGPRLLTMTEDAAHNGNGSFPDLTEVRVDRNTVSILRRPDSAVSKNETVPAHRGAWMPVALDFCTLSALHVDDNTVRIRDWPLRAGAMDLLPDDAAVGIGIRLLSVQSASTVQRNEVTLGGRHHSAVGLSVQLGVVTTACGSVSPGPTSSAQTTSITDNRVAVTTTGSQGQHIAVGLAVQASSTENSTSDHRAHSWMFDLSGNRVNISASYHNHTDGGAAVVALNVTNHGERPLIATLSGEVHTVDCSRPASVAALATAISLSSTSGVAPSVNAAGCRLRTRSTGAATAFRILGVNTSVADDRLTSGRSADTQTATVTLADSELSLEATGADGRAAALSLGHWHETGSAAPTVQIGQNVTFDESVTIDVRATGSHQLMPPALVALGSQVPLGASVVLQGMRVTSPAEAWVPLMVSPGPVEDVPPSLARALSAAPNSTIRFGCIRQLHAPTASSPRSSVQVSQRLNTAARRRMWSVLTPSPIDCAPTHSKTISSKGTASLHASSTHTAPVTPSFTSTHTTSPPGVAHATASATRAPRGTSSHTLTSRNTPSRDVSGTPMLSGSLMQTRTPSHSQSPTAGTVTGTRSLTETRSVQRGATHSRQASATASLSLVPTQSRQPSTTRTLPVADAQCTFAFFTIRVSPPGAAMADGAMLVVRAAALAEETIELRVRPGGGPPTNRFSATPQSIGATAVTDGSGLHNAQFVAREGLAAQWSSAVGVTVRNSPNTSDLVISIRAGTSIAIAETEYIRVGMGPESFACAVEGTSSPQAFVFAVEPAPDRALAAAESTAQVTAVSSVAVAGVSGSPAAVGDAQSLALLGLVSCGSPASRAVSQRMRMLLSLVPLGVDNDSEAAILGNTVLVSAVGALQLIVACALHLRATKFRHPLHPLASKPSSREALATVRFPGIVLIALQLQHPGTAVHAFSLILRGSVTALSLLGFLNAIGTPLIVYLVVHRATVSSGFVPDQDRCLVLKRYKNTYQLVPWVRDDPNPASIRRRVWRWLGPCAKWGPAVPSKMYGAPIRQLRSAWLVFAIAPTLQSVLVAAVTAMPIAPGPLCGLQYAVLAIIAIAFPSVIAYIQPYRVRVLAPLRVASGLALALAVGLSGYLANSGDDMSETSLSLLSFASGTVTLTGVLQLAVLVLVKVTEIVYLGDGALGGRFLESTRTGDPDADDEGSPQLVMPNESDLTLSFDLGPLSMSSAPTAAMTSRV